MTHFSRHITRNYNANKTHRIRYDDDNFTCKIYKYDKTKESQYSVFKKGTIAYTNGVEKNWRGMKVLKSKYDKELSVKVVYDASESSSNYRLECLYANTYKVTKRDNVVKKDITSLDKTFKTSVSIYIDGVLQEDANGSNWNSSDINFNRHHHYVSMKKGKRTIEFRFSPNSIFIGLSIKKYDVWTATRHNDKNDNLTMIKATVEHTNEFDINTMTAEFMYHHDLDEVLDPTNANANRSGLVFDYRDEINLKVTDTNGHPQLVFGGYISTASVDDDLTTVTLECADRLIDLDRRYNISEIKMNPQEYKEDYSYAVDFLKRYTYYSSALKYLLKSTELPMKTNVNFDNPLDVRNYWKLVNYRSGSINPLDKNNMDVSLNKKSITLRNGDVTGKQQYVTVYMNKSREICLNDYPHLYFHYGMGTPKWDYNYSETTYTVVEKAMTDKQKTWLARANKITKASGDNCIKPIWKWIATKTTRSSKSDFYQSVEKTWKDKSGNCCCRTELLLTLLSAKGLTDLKYVHTKRSDGGGHVFAKVNGFYVDPSTSQESRGWHNHITGYGSIVKVTDYPKKPF